MALKLLQPGGLPLGQFDLLDGLISGSTTIKGGELVTFTSLQLPNSDKAAADVFDGYAPGLAGTAKRTYVTNTLGNGSRPLMLTDDGITGYGTLFGTVVGGTVGQVSSGGAVLGPHTSTGSGKVTLWDKAGLYAVSLDACDTTAATGLQPTNASLAAGSKIYATTAGILTPLVGSAFETSLAIGNFVEFETNGSLVNTPNRLVGTLNTPDGALSSVVNRSYAFAVFYFNPPTS